MSLVEAELGGPTVFKDLAKLDFDWVPTDLPGREAEIKRLTGIYRGMAQGPNREHALLWGPVGTGKTALAKRFAYDLAAALAKQGKRLESVHVNCRKLKSAGLAMLAIVNRFEPNYPERGFSVGEMLRDLRKMLHNKGVHLLVILDEVDALLKSDGSNLVYDLTRFNDESGPAWVGVSLLMVSQENVLPLLDNAALSTFKSSNVLRIDPYGAPQLETIVQQRVALAFYPGTVDGDTICLIADIAAQDGNARLAIEVLHKAGQIADDEGKPQVHAEEVRAAKESAHSYITTAKLVNLPRHALFALLALARRLKREGGAYATTGAVEEVYKLVCEEFGEEPRGHTQFWKYLNQLRDGGFILSRLSGKGQTGTTQLLSIPDAPAGFVESKLSELLRHQPAV
ncbi:MAG: Cdc6/Cdc18 family protein [Thermoplasmatota archaeon]